MKALVHWMVSFAKLHLTPLMMTLQLKILPLKPQRKISQATSPRVMTDRELLLSLHQKVDRNHKWVKRQFGSILHNMTATHNAVKKNHYYLHETLNRTWAVLSHIYSAEDLKKMGLQEDFDWSAPPPKEYKKVKVPSLVASSYSSSRDTDEHEDLDDTAAGPTTTQDPDNAGAPPSS